MKGSLLLERIFAELSQKKNVRCKSEGKKIFVTCNNEPIFEIMEDGCIKRLHVRNDDLFFWLFDIISKIRADILSESLLRCE